MIADKKLFLTGLAMLVGFIIVLVLIFMPIFNGQNGLDTLDALFNSISKGSAYKNIMTLKEGITSFDGNEIDVSLTMPGAEQTRHSALLFERSGARVYMYRIRTESVRRPGPHSSKCPAGCRSDVRQQQRSPVRQIRP